CENQDPCVPQNFVLKKPDGSTVPIGDTAITTGPATVKHNVPALNAGEYPFLCEVHPNTMKGVLTVGWGAQRGPGRPALLRRRLPADGRGAGHRRRRRRRGTARRPGP